MNFALWAIVATSVGLGLRMALMHVGLIWANVLGCFIIGLAFALKDENLLKAESFQVIAFFLCGSLTTFSGLVLEALERESNFKSVQILLGHMVLGILFYVLGKKIIQVFVLKM